MAFYLPQCTLQPNNRCLKEYKKVKHQDQDCVSVMLCSQDLEALLREREPRMHAAYKTPQATTTTNIDTYINFSHGFVHINA